MLELVGAVVLPEPCVRGRQPLECVGQPDRIGSLRRLPELHDGGVKLARDLVVAHVQPQASQVVARLEGIPVALAKLSGLDRQRFLVGRTRQGVLARAPGEMGQVREAQRDVLVIVAERVAADRKRSFVERAGPLVVAHLDQQQRQRIERPGDVEVVGTVYLFLEGERLLVHGFRLVELRELVMNDRQVVEGVGQPGVTGVRALDLERLLVDPLGLLLLPRALSEDRQVHQRERYVRM